MSRRNVFKNLDNAVEYLFSEQIEADLLALPPEVDELTDEEPLEEENPSGLPADIAGFIELQEHDSVESSDEDNVPLADLVSVSAPKKLRKETPKKLIPKWEKVNPSYEHFEPEHDFLEKDENLKTSMRDKTVVDLFEQFFDDAVYDLIFEETMRYAAQKNKHNFSITKDEIKIFIGFLLFSGYHTLPSERDYWSDDDDLGQSIVKNALSRNAYLEIKSMIHVQDNTKAHENRADKSFKIRPLLDKMNENFQKFGLFQENLSIDEMIVR
ncbi:piggyBac transposable element-derived protein 2-like [Coccinella septempunctata]|uniref:piggyBac transposable element-derived protein 2-like n=1 Tax=Coccinella septempunctata TaxID=41139 RepID=UPI001D06D139|nr:piggyBac transposable element-derived protein 2-like [Coccinella septempunctata]